MSHQQTVTAEFFNHRKRNLSCICPAFLIVEILRSIDNPSLTELSCKNCQGCIRRKDHYLTVDRSQFLQKFHAFSDRHIHLPVSCNDQGSVHISGYCLPDDLVQILLFHRSSFLPYKSRQFCIHLLH